MYSIQLMRQCVWGHQVFFITKFNGWRAAMCYQICCCIRIYQTSCCSSFVKFCSRKAMMCLLTSTFMSIGWSTRLRSSLFLHSAVPPHAHNLVVLSKRIFRCLTILCQSVILKFQPIWLLEYFVPIPLITLSN